MIDQNALVAELDEFSAEIERLQEEARQAAQAVFKNGVKIVFEQFGDIVGEFGWLQYTPYFNDGDECIFHSCEPYVLSPEEAKNEEWKAENSYYYGDDGEGVFSSYADVNKVSEVIDCGEWVEDPNPPNSWSSRKYVPNDQPNPNYDPRHKAAKEYVDKLLAVIDDNVLKQLFGDHVHVAVQADDIIVEEYAHD